MDPLGQVFVISQAVQALCLNFLTRLPVNLIKINCADALEPRMQVACLF